MNYKEYLNSDKWKKLRKQARKKAKGKCELCRGIPFNVHHVTYPKNLEKDSLDNLLVVCKKCHNKLHGIKDSKKHLMKVIEKRINYKDTSNLISDYIGIDMSKTHSQDNSIIDNRNKSVFNLFKDYLNIDYIMKHFDCWKGSCFWNDEEFSNRKWGDSTFDFGGWTSKDILFWLILNKGRYKDGDSISEF